MKHPFHRILLLVTLLLGLPLAGVALAGKPLARYFEFPPRSQYIEHAGFSWAAFVLIAGFTTACAMPFVVHLVRRRGAQAPHLPSSLPPAPPPVFKNRVTGGGACAPFVDDDETKGWNEMRSASNLVAPHPFPWWGWLGLLLGAVAWVIAWNRFPWVAPLQYHTFTPLWVAYILTINALTYRRTGHCMMLDRTRFFLLLLPLSAGFWWFFEYLNRFVQNWHYTAESFTAGEYFWYATLPFATVLAAVLGTREWLASFPLFRDGFQGFAQPSHCIQRLLSPRRSLRRSAGRSLFPQPRNDTKETVIANLGNEGVKQSQTYKVIFQHPRRFGMAILLLSALGLLLIGVFPNQMFPLLWVSPLLIIVSLQMIAGEGHVLEDITRGDWRFVVTCALAALVCGFFWELWNSHSLAKWYYTVPYVNRFHLFEMPLLGFAGYLPFGLECAAVGMVVSPSQPIN